MGRLSFSVVGLLGRPVSGSGSGAFASCAVWLGCFYRCWECRARRKLRVQCLAKGRRIFLAFFVRAGSGYGVLLGLTWRSKGRAVSWRFYRFVIYQALGLRSPSVNGKPLSFTLGNSN